MKLYLILIVGIFVGLVSVYYIGLRDGKNTCNLRASQNIVQQQIHLIKLQENINAETVGCATGDIRRILREKYTIAE